VASNGMMFKLNIMGVHKLFRDYWRGQTHRQGDT